MNRDRDENLKKGKKYCLRLLASRPRSEYEIETRLKSSGYADTERGRILEELKNAGYVDDLEFAKEWISSRMRSNPRGARLLAEELKSKGVPENIIRKALTIKSGDIDERQVVLELVRGGLRTAGSSPEVKLKAKLYRTLIRKGFDPEIIEDIVTSEVRVQDHEFE